MGSISDDKGYNQGFILKSSTIVRMKRRADFLCTPMLNKNKNVLEIGCGTGEIAYWIAQNNLGLSVLGTDICVPFINEAIEKYTLPNLKYEILDFNNPEKINNRKFDYIIGNGILHHLYYNLDETFSKFTELLEPGGKIIFMEPNIYNPYIAAIFNIKYLRKKAKLEPDEMAFSKSFIQKKLENLHFKNIQISYKDFLLPGIPLFLVKPSIFIGNILEKIPLLKCISQSILIVADKK